MLRCIYKILFTGALLLATVPIFAGNTILILGDSLSSGYGISEGKSWVDLIKKQLSDKKYNYQIINLSIAGHTTSDGLEQLPEALAQYKPEITIIELGGNDGLRGIQITAIKENLQQAINLAKKAHSKILLVGVRIPPNYGPQYTQQFHDNYLNLAKENNIAIVPYILANVDDRNDLISEDRIHPNEKAQPIVMNNIWKELNKLLHKTN